MVDPFLKTHYRRGATDLTPEQIEEIRHLKNKRSQQSKKYILAEILSTDKKAEHSISDSSPANVVAHEPTQPIQVSKKDTNNENMDASYEKMVEKSTKILDVKKKRYPENNLPIP
ncbi:hypothetical protein RhiirC2_795138 [Rhizophagus irregularis]|uniref:Uncharacterized protein n=1 Tax=Rhizophagus irregularis TaxID=588596 RepID=A0A2N1MC67_9GLOM|nr:hypothetical protein RhiirC2_795138 [Rhizophagus irregularis]